MTIIKDDLVFWLFVICMTLSLLCLGLILLICYWQRQDRQRRDNPLGVKRTGDRLDYK